MSSSTTSNWHNDIDVRRKGAGYFLLQSGRLRFDPTEYIACRALPRKFSEPLVQEWTQWMSELKKSQHESVRRAATSALPLTRVTLNEYYQSRLLDDRAFEAMESSVEQVTAADKKITKLLRKEFEADEPASTSFPKAPAQCEPFPAEGSSCSVIQSKDDSSFKPAGESVSSPSALASLAQRTGKRTAAQIVQTSCKKRSGSTIVRGESVAGEEYHDSDGTVVDGAGKTSKSRVVADEKSDSVGEEKVQDNEGAESPIQELQDLSEASGVAAQKGLHKFSTPLVSASIVSSSPRASFGRSLTIEDLYSRKRSALSSDDIDEYLSNATPPIYSPRNILGVDLPSSDPADPNYREDWSLDLSTSRLYSWNFLQGPGRVDSGVDSHWVHYGVEVGRDLLSFRDRIVDNNGGICDPYEMLAINFIFLVEAEYQTGGLQGEVEDQVWDALCDAVKDPVSPLPDDIALEALRWTHRLAQNRSEQFSQLLEDSPPNNRTLRSILTRMSDNTQLWNTQRRNEDTYLKSQLGPFLDSYFGKLRFTKSDWATTQEETRGPGSNILIPDYAVTTEVGKQQLSVALLEGKISRNAGRGQVWDDLTKIGQEMKAALDTIIKMQPQADVCVVGILVKEPLVEFYTMKLHAEATYLMNRFAAAYVPSEAVNMFPIVHLMEVFEHARTKVEQTVEQLRRVKVHPSPNPKVPLSWIRPSFVKPKLCHIADGH